MEILFLGKFGPKSQNFISWSLNLVARLIQTCRIQWWCSLFCFWLEIPFWGKFSPKSQNYKLKLKFGTYTNLNMQNSMMLFTFFFFEWKYSFWANLLQTTTIVTLSWNLVPTPVRTYRIQWLCSFFLFWAEISFLGKFGPKRQNYQFKLRFGACTNSNMLNSIVMFTFFVFNWKYPFWGNLVQKSELSV